LICIKRSDLATSKAAKGLVEDLKKLAQLDVCREKKRD
jgi:hypothetical protein